MFNRTGTNLHYQVVQIILTKNKDIISPVGYSTAITLNQKVFLALTFAEKVRVMFFRYARILKNVVD